MVTAALFTIAKIRKHPKCPSIDEWLTEAGHIYNGILRCHKENGVLPFVTTWMDLESIMLGETNKEKYHMNSCIY